MKPEFLVHWLVLWLQNNRRMAVDYYHMAHGGRTEEDVCQRFEDALNRGIPEAVEAYLEIAPDEAIRAEYERRFGGVR